MGSLYDIGNFRYKHFTFYSHCGDNCKDFDNDASAELEIKKFLNDIWPFRGLLVGESSEGDYAFVTYVSQFTEDKVGAPDFGSVKQKIDNIWIFTRLSIGGSEPQWTRAVNPVKTLVQDNTE